MSFKRKGHPRNATPAGTDGRTKQDFKHDADPNTLMRAFSKTGKKELFEQTDRIAQYGDFSNTPDFFSALLQVQEVKEDYENLPIQVRRATHNSPNELFEMLSDPSKLDQCIELGLIEDTQTEALSIPTAPPQPAPDLPPPGEPKPDGSVQGGE